MSLQNAAAQLLQVEKQQIELEAQIKSFQLGLAKLQGDNWQTHFTQQLTAIKQQVGKMEELLKQRTIENKKLTEERNSVQKQIDELTEKLRAAQKPKKVHNDDQKEKHDQKEKPKCGGTMDKAIDDNIRSIAAKIKDTVIKKAKSDDNKCKFDEFTPVKAKSQVLCITASYIVLPAILRLYHVNRWLLALIGS